MHSPAREVADRSFREIMPKTLGEYGAGQAHFSRKRGNSPGLCRVPMEHGQGFTGVLVTHAREPTGLRRRQRGNVSP